MPVNKRRETILKELKETKYPIPGSLFAKELNVSRQIIVQDIAVLRANGNNIISTNKGYIISKDNVSSITGVREIIPVCHDKEKILDELYTIVDLGGKTIDVVVEHSIYGEIKGALLIESRYDANKFYEALNENKAQPLSNLTNGVHLHTVEAPNREVLDMIINNLKEKGIYIE